MPCIAAWITATIPVEGSAGRRDVIRQGRGLVLSPRLPGRLPVKGSCKGLAPGSRADQFLYRIEGREVLPPLQGWWKTCRNVSWSTCSCLGRGVLGCCSCRILGTKRMGGEC